MKIAISTAHSANEGASFTLSRPQPPKLALLERIVNLVDVFVNIYSIVAFIMTSSFVSTIFMDQSRFMNDVAMGLYDFTPRSKSDELMFYAMKNASFGQSRSLGVRDGAMAFAGGGNSSSLCLRINNTFGVSYQVVYNYDGISRRFLHQDHGKLPPSCTGWTVKPGGSLNDTPIRRVDDTRSSYGQSYLHCIDPSYYSPSFSDTGNKTNFRFRVGYVVAQEYFVGASYGYVTHLSYCQANKIDDTLYYKVSPYPANDTTSEVHVLFSNKSVLLYILDYGGQIIVLSVLAREIHRVSTQLCVKIPTISVYKHERMLSFLLAKRYECLPHFNGGRGYLNLSQIWLGSSWYLIGNCMYALGTTFESQMLVEVLSWQWNLAGHYIDLARGAMYAMRHAWVSIGVWTLVRLSVMHLLSPWWLSGLAQQIRLIEMYCSCRILILAFIFSSFLTTQMRGKYYLMNRVNVVDDGLGMKKGLLWESEIFQSLAINHSLGLIFGATLSFFMRHLLQWISPNHRENTFFTTIDKHRFCSGFDMARLVTGSRSIVVGTHCVLLLPLADLYMIYSSVNLWSSTAMPEIPELRDGYAVKVSSSKKGSIMKLEETDVFLLELHNLQTAHRNSKYKYFAIM